MATKTAAVDAKGYRKFGFRDVLAYGLGDFGCNMSFALKGGRRSVLRALDRRSLRCKVHSVRGRLYPVGCVLHRCQRSLRLHAFSDHG